MFSILLIKVESRAHPSNPVHFHAQRNSSFNLANTAINFTSAQVNTAELLTLSSGVFTVIQDGTYRFFFSGIRDSASANPLKVTLRKIVRTVPIDIAEAYCAVINGYYTSCSLEAIVELKLGEYVYLHNTGNGVLYDNEDHLTQFTGSLLDV